MKRAVATKFAPESWRNRDPSERRILVNLAFVQRDKLNPIVVTMDKMRRDFRENAETKCMVVIGEPGVGKSTLFERYRDNARVDPITTETHVKRPKPVVYVELPSDATVNICSDAILSELRGQQVRTNGRSKDGLLEAQLRISEVELIILDDFQHAASRGREKTQSQTADFVKSITKRSRIPVVMAGLPELAALIDNNRQLQTITPYKHSIPSFHFETPGQKGGFRRFLQDLDALLPFDERTGLGDKGNDGNDYGLSGAIFLATAGLLRPLKGLISAAAAMAIDDDSACIRGRDLHDAWNAGHRDASSKINPFTGFVMI